MFGNGVQTGQMTLSLVQTVFIEAEAGDMVSGRVLHRIIISIHLTNTVITSVYGLHFLKSKPNFESKKENYKMFTCKR